MKRRFATAVAIAGVVLAMQSAAPADPGRVERKVGEICAKAGVGTRPVMTIATNWGPNMPIYQNLLKALPDCVHAP